MDLVRLVEEKILSVVERIFAVLDGKTNYHSFELRLKKELDGLGCDLLEYVIEALKQKVEEDAKQDPNWKRVRKDDRKELLTLLVRSSTTGAITDIEKAKNMPTWLTNKLVSLPTCA